MKIDDFNSKIESKIDNAQNVTDLKGILKDLTDENIILRKQLNVIISSLNSENVREIDFRYTRYPKAKDSILKGLASEMWVTANFVHK